MTTETVDERPDACRICGNREGNTRHPAREMFAGTREPFTYVECAACGTVQLRDIPDLSPYYAHDYYSLRPAVGDDAAGPPGLKKRAGALVRRSIASYYCRRRAPLGEYRRPVGRLLARRLGRMGVGFPEYLRDAATDLRLGLKSAVLDVGSGAGHTLISLSKFGFRDLTGIDPFLAADIDYGNGVRVLKRGLSEVDRQFDLILANHSVEHVADPAGALREMRRLLRPGRFAVVRLPVLGHAWRHYGADWVQLDPPRHLHLFRPDAFAALAERAGFAVREVMFDSTAFQFWGSEQYRRDIPLLDPRSHFVNPAASPFGADELASFAARAAELNARREGDQAAFFLTPSGGRG